MLRSAWILVAVCLILSSAGLAQDKGRFDAGFNAAAVFTHASSGNGIRQSATIGSEYFGTFRYRFRPKHSLIFNYGRIQNSQIYQTNFDYHVVTRTTEYSGAYAYNFVARGKFEPFVLVGAGALKFAPQSTWLFLPDFVPGVPNRLQLTLNASKQTALAYIYGGGLDYRLPLHFALRLQYRGLLYNSPDFKVNPNSGSAVSFHTGSKGHMAEPSIGLVFRF